MGGKIAFITCVLFALISAGSQYSPAQSVRKHRLPNSAQPSPTASPVSVADRPDADDQDVIRVTTQLVSIPVRVMDKNGRFVDGLAKGDFKVFADGVEQQIALFSNEEQPFTVVLVLDMSYSTNFKIADIQAAAISFIDKLRPQDRVMVVSFDQEVHLLCDVTTDRKLIYAALKKTKIGTGTSLYEAMDTVMNGRLRQIEGRKAIILFTDGVDTTSRRSEEISNLNDAMELDALIYPIRYDTYADVQRMKRTSKVPSPSPGSEPISTETGNLLPFPVERAADHGTTAADYKTARDYLEQLAERTGGRSYLADNLENLSNGFARIAAELREFYSLGIYPGDTGLGNPRKLKVRVDQPGLVVRARDSFSLTTPQTRKP